VGRVGAGPDEPEAVLVVLKLGLDLRLGGTLAVLRVTEQGSE
jgi:hypothetical protein